MSKLEFADIAGEVIEAMMQTEKCVNGFQTVPMGTLELMRYYVALLNGCAYCLDMHFKEAVHHGESEKKLYSVSVWRETSYYSEQEQAMLAWTEVVTKLDVDDATRALVLTRLKAQFSPADISKLTLAIIQINAWTRIAKPFAFDAGHYQVGQFD